VTGHAELIEQLNEWARHLEYVADSERIPAGDQAEADLLRNAAAALAAERERADEFERNLRDNMVTRGAFAEQVVRAEAAEAREAALREAACELLDFLDLEDDPWWDGENAYSRLSALARIAGEQP
jgi:hypothetical protein